MGALTELTDDDLRVSSGTGQIRQGGAEGVRYGAQIWSTIAAETLT